MTIAAQQPITLESFLQLPETKPASEYINGAIIQKPTQGGKQSRLSLKLCNAINDLAERQKIAYALLGLRCTFAERSLVPSLAVFTWNRLPLNEDGELIDDVFIAPDWTIEVLSPEQGSNRLTGNILHCLQHGCSLGWLVDPGDRSILAFLPKQEPVLYEGDDRLPILETINLSLTANEVFGWLKMSR